MLVARDERALREDIVQREGRCGEELQEVWPSCVRATRETIPVTDAGFSWMRMRTARQYPGGKEDSYAVVKVVNDCGCDMT